MNATIPGLHVCVCVCVCVCVRACVRVCVCIDFLISIFGSSMCVKLLYKRDSQCLTYTQSTDVPAASRLFVHPVAMLNEANIDGGGQSTHIKSNAEMIVHIRCLHDTHEVMFCFLVIMLFIIT